MVYERFWVRTSSTVPGERSCRWTPPSISDWTMLLFTASLKLAWGGKNRGCPQVVFMKRPLDRRAATRSEPVRSYLPLAYYRCVPVGHRMRAILTKGTKNLVRTLG